MLSHQHPVIVLVVLAELTKITLIKFKFIFLLQSIQKNLNTVYINILIKLKPSWW